MRRACFAYVTVNMKRLAIWGASSHAVVVADIVRCQGSYEIVGFLDDVSVDRKNTEFCGAKVLGGAEQLDALHEARVDSFIIAIGDCDARLRIASLVEARGFRLVAAVHPRAVIASSASVGDGTVIAAGAVVNPGAVIGKNVIINTAASVDHECVLEDGVHIGPGVHLGGKCRIGTAAWIGIGATVKDRINIGARSIVGAGAVVLRDIPENVVAYGVPARVVRGNTTNEK